MGEEQKIMNKKICHVRDTPVILEALDFERLETLGLPAHFVLYVSSNEGNNGITAYFKGPIQVSGERFPEITSLPRPHYYFEGLEMKGKYDHDRLPIGLAIGTDKPKKLEFSLDIPEKDYRGLRALHESFIPRLFNSGYNQYNPRHTSEFQLNFGKQDDYLASLFLSSYGLDIFFKENSSVKVFTEKDLERLTNLESKKLVRN